MLLKLFLSIKFRTANCTFVRLFCFVFFRHLLTPFSAQISTIKNRWVYAPPIFSCSKSHTSIAGAGRKAPVLLKTTLQALREKKDNLNFIA